MDELHAPITNIHIAHMREERKRGNETIFSEKVSDSITSTTSDVVIYVQRKGYAAVATCHNCGYTARCNTCSVAEIYYETSKSLKCHYCKTSHQIPSLCPECKKASLNLYGIGTEQVVSYLKELHLPHTTIIRSDGNLDELQHISLGTKNIIVGTEAMFRNIDWTRISTIIWLDIDTQLQYPDYRASEHVWHTLKELQYRAPQAMLYIQTYDPTQLLLRSLHEPERLYRTELHARKTLQFPPYTKLIRLSTGGVSAYAAEREADRVFSLLSRVVKKHSLHLDITYPIATYPTLHRGRYWYTILLKLDPTTWHTDLAMLTKELPSTWRIDPSPQSLLSP
jgi:primosomal protein N' (replication factor Y)